MSEYPLYAQNRYKGQKNASFLTCNSIKNAPLENWNRQNPHY